MPLGTVKRGAPRRLSAGLSGVHFARRETSPARTGYPRSCHGRLRGILAGDVGCAQVYIPWYMPPYPPRGIHHPVHPWVHPRWPHAHSRAGHCAARQRAARARSPGLSSEKGRGPCIFCALGRAEVLTFLCGARAGRARSRKNKLERLDSTRASLRAGRPGRLSAPKGTRAQGGPGTGQDTLAAMSSEGYCPRAGCVAH